MKRDTQKEHEKWEMLFGNGKTDAIPKLKIALCKHAYR